MNDNKEKSRIVQLSIEAFSLHDSIVRGTLTGGIVPPRIVLSAEERDDGAVMVRWKNPLIGGLSDRVYHFTNIGPFEDIFKVTEDNKLVVNGELEKFGLDLETSFVIRYHWKEITGFCRRWNLQTPYPVKGMDPVIRRVLEVCRG